MVVDGDERTSDDAANKCENFLMQITKSEDDDSSSDTNEELLNGKLFDVSFIRLGKKCKEIFLMRPNPLFTKGRLIC